MKNWLLLLFSLCFFQKITAQPTPTCDCNWQQASLFYCPFGGGNCFPPGSPNQGGVGENSTSVVLSCNTVPNIYKAFFNPQNPDGWCGEGPPSWFCTNVPGGTFYQILWTGTPGNGELVWNSPNSSSATCPCSCLTNQYAPPVLAAPVTSNESAALSWAFITFSNQYQLHFRPQSSGVEYAWKTKKTTTSHQLVEDLLFNSTYQYEVRAKKQAKHGRHGQPAPSPPKTPRTAPHPSSPI